MQNQPQLEDSEPAPQRLPTASAFHHLPTGLIIAGIVTLILAAGSGTAWWAWNSVKSPTPPVTPATPIASQAPQPTPTRPVVGRTVQVYWLKETDGKLGLVASPLTLNQSNQSDQILTAALNQLLAGPTNSQVASTIPQGTTLRSVTIEPDGIHVDLSSEFKSGGGSTSMTGRLGQIVYTATTLEPNAKVWISVNSEPLEVLGGEGLEIDQPMTRHSFEENFSL